MRAVVGSVENREWRFNSDVSYYPSRTLSPDLARRLPERGRLCGVHVRDWSQ